MNHYDKYLRYEPETGKLFWKERNNKRWNTRYAGTEAFTAINKAGYHVGNLFNKTYRAHRVIWEMCHGSPAPDIIDHINRDKLDNRVANLRPATKSENACNSETSNVRWCGGREKWVAQVTKDYKNYGRRFDSYQDAVKWANFTKVKLHKEFAYEETC